MGATKYIFLFGVVVLCVLGANGLPEVEIETEVIKKHHHHHHHHHKAEEILFFEASPTAGKAAAAVEAGLAELGIAAVEGEKILATVLKPIITFLNALAVKIGVLVKGLWGVLVIDLWAGVQKIGILALDFWTAIGLTAIKTGALAPLIKAVITYYDLVAEKLAILATGLGEVLFVEALVGLQKIGVLVAEFWAVTAGGKKLIL